MDAKWNASTSRMDSEIEFEPLDFSDNENPQTWLLCVDGHKDIECDLARVLDLTKPAPPEFNVTPIGEGISSETIMLPAESETLDSSQETYTALNKTFEIISPEFKENLLTLQAESLSISEIDMLSFVSDISNRMTPLSTSGSNIKRVPNDNKVSLEDSDGSYKMPGYSTPKNLLINNKTFELKKDVESPDHVINTKTFIRPKKNRKSIVQELAHRYFPDPQKSEDVQKFEVPSHKTVEQASCDQSSQLVSEPKKYHSAAVGMPTSLVKVSRVEERNLTKMNVPSFTAENHSTKSLLGRKMASVEDLRKPFMGLRKPAFFSSTLDMRKIGPAIGNAEAGPSSSDSAPSKRKGPPVTRSRIPVPSSQRGQQ